MSGFARVDGGDDLDWHDGAKCNGLPHLFFSEDGKSEPGRKERVRKARALCEACPVSEPCLNYALKYNIKEGIWGGMTERERRAEQRRRKTEPKEQP